MNFLHKVGHVHLTNVTIIVLFNISKLFLKIINRLFHYGYNYCIFFAFTQNSTVISKKKN